MPRQKNQVNFYPCTEIKSSSIPHIKIESISTNHTQTKSSSMLALNSSDFQLAYKNQVNFDHRDTKTKSIDPYVNTKSF